MHQCTCPHMCCMCTCMLFVCAYNCFLQNIHECRMRILWNQHNRAILLIGHGRTANPSLPNASTPARVIKGTGPLNPGRARLRFTHNTRGMPAAILWFFFFESHQNVCQKRTHSRVAHFLVPIKIYWGPSPNLLFFGVPA